MMLVKNHQNALFFFAGAFLTLVLFLALAWHGPSFQLPDLFKNLSLDDDVPNWSSAHDANGGSTAPGSPVAGDDTNAVPDPAQDSGFHGKYGDISDLLTEEEHEASNANMQIPHTEVYSNMTSDGNLFHLNFLDEGSYNPNILPHPYKPDTYILVAQRDKQHDDNTIWNAELVCEAQFHNETNTMRCTKSPLLLPIAATTSDLCHGDMEYFNTLIGPHDARIFYGPDTPYIIYGSQSDYNCLGQWIQDLRRITDWSRGSVTNRTDLFYYPTILQRPPPYGQIEKNWFAFWDDADEMYLHYDIAPQRVFAKVAPDGSVGEDLAPRAAPKDDICLGALMPPLRPRLEWVHQATNTLRITMCARADPACTPTPANTHLFMLFQTKTFYYHGNYEPYAMLISQTAPFEVLAVSKQPIWINGRGRPFGNWTDQAWKPKDQAEMMFITTMSFTEPGVMYHGYLDDEVFISFGIEDQDSGAIDVVVQELLKDLTYCRDVPGWNEAVLDGVAAGVLAL